MTPFHMVLFGKYRIRIEEAPTGSGRWFYSIGMLVAGRFEETPTEQQVGPFESADRAVRAGRCAVTGSRGTSAQPG